MAGKTLTVTDQTFAEQVLQADTPVLVDFGAPWCPPCRAIAPALEELAHSFAGDVVIAKVDTDENPRTTAEYGIMALPTIVVFQHGQVRDKLVGARPKGFYSSYIQELIGRGEAVGKE
jgi:thioredoxin 1